MRRIFIALAAALVCVAASAQTTSAEFNERYQKQVARMGYAGVGVEYIIDKWEKAYPEDGTMLEARFNYLLVKGLSSQAVRKDQKKWLGADPIISIPDSTGNKVNYFEEQFFDDTLFGQAIDTIDKAIAIYPNELMYRVDKISALLSYEKESPDMSVEELLALAKIQKDTNPQWTISGQEVAEGDFPQVMSEYCVRLYNIGTPSGYEAFRTLSETMNKMYPKEPDFLNNLGSYWLVAKDNEKKATKYYKKALKIDPENAVAKQNLKIIERRDAQRKKQKKSK